MNEFLCWSIAVCTLILATIFFRITVFTPVDGSMPERAWLILLSLACGICCAFFWPLVWTVAIAYGVVYGMLVLWDRFLRRGL